MKKASAKAQKLFLATAVALLLSVSASAETGDDNAPKGDEFRPYKKVGVCPYKGTSEGAYPLIMAEREKIRLPNLSFAEWMIGVYSKIAGQCTRHFVQEGERITTTQSCPGQPHKAANLYIDFGTDILPDDPARASWSCPTGNKDGLAVLFLDTCSNWSVHTPVLPIPKEPPLPVLVLDEPPEDTQVTSSEEMLKNKPLRIAGVPGCCNCDGQSKLGLTIGGNADDYILGKGKSNSWTIPTNVKLN